MWTEFIVRSYGENDEGEGGVFRAWSNIEKFPWMIVFFLK